ncbi:MAG: hypothetical protein ACTS10_21570 [Kiloniellales bacterium]
MKGANRTQAAGDQTTARPTFVVHSLRQALAAAEAAAATGRPLNLLTPESGLSTQGPLFWAEVQKRLGATAAAEAVMLWVDAEDTPALALAALRCGLRRLIFKGSEEVATKLEAIVTAAGGLLLRERPKAQDLLEEPDPASAVAARLRLTPAIKPPRQR